MSDSEEFASADEDVTPEVESTKKKQLNVEDKGKKEQKSGIRKLGPSSDKPPRVSKLGEKTATKPESTTTAHPPPNVEACWEFESWEDYDKEEKRKAKQEEPVEKQPSTDGWDDDWEQEVPETPMQSSEKKEAGPRDDDVSKVLDKLTLGASSDQKSQGGWGWGNSWGGISSFISTATTSVATLTSQVSQGLSTVIESGIGVPDPSEMARQDRVQEEEKRKRDGYEPSPSTPEKTSNSGLGSFVTGVSQMSSKVISGGLDTLEGIGKKTMNMLQENDPGLMNKRKLLGLDGGDNRPVLSQMLREAKTQSEEKERNMKQLQKNLYKKQLHFETLFDDYCGLVHLEALEMLSKQSTIKLESLLAPLSGKALKEMQETMGEVQELCELPDMEDESDGMHSVDELESRLTTAFEDMENKVDFQDLIEVWRKDLRFLETDNPRSAQELYDRSLHSLAQTTAVAVNRMHKLGELLLIQEQHSTVNEADSLVQLTTTLCWHLGGIAARFGSMLSDEKNFVITDDEDVNGLITSIFLEGTNSTSYIQNAFQLFVPILQLGAA